MNLETHSTHQEIASLQTHHHTTTPEITRCDSSSPMLAKFLPPLLTQNNKAGGGLSAIPQATLYDNLQPVIAALEKLDAERLLDLELTGENQGPRVREG